MDETALYTILAEGTIHSDINSVMIIPHPYPNPPIEGEGNKCSLSIRERAGVRVG